MQFHGGLGLSKARPRKQRQAQVDGRGVQCVDGLVQIDAEGFPRIQPAGDANQGLRELRVDAPIAGFVGVGQCTATHVAAQAQVIQLGRLRAQAGFDVAQTFSVGQLRKGHAQELIQTAERANVEVAVILGDQMAKRVPGHELHEVCEDELASVHRSLPGKSRQAAELHASDSNR